MDVLRKVHFKVYAFEVNTCIYIFFAFICLYKLNSVNTFLYLLYISIMLMKYPPIMSAVKNSDGNITTYEGFSVDFINYLAQHFELRLEYH